MQNPSVVAVTQNAVHYTTHFAYLFNRARSKVHWALVLGALVLADPGHLSNAVGAVLVGLGEGLRLWASGYLDKAGGLCTSGPYAHVRHPLYLGTMSMVLGFAVLINHWQHWYLTPLLLALVVAFYGLQIVLEERSLHRYYGPEFQDYARSVPALLPRLRRPSGDPGTGFRWAQVLRNREHLRALWALFAVAIFEVKTELMQAGLSWLSPLTHH